MGGDLKRRGGRLLSRQGEGRQGGYQPGPFAAIYSALLAAGVVAAAVVYFVLLAAVPGATTNRLDVAKTALLVVGGSGAVAGLYVAYRKQRTDEANHLRDQDKLFTERYTAAVAQLGNTTSAAIRLGGVYALARIADDSERDRSTCMKVLCAYLRMPYDPGGPDSEPAERQVRTTAQAIIGERLRPGHLGFWPNANIDLAGAYLIDFSLQGATVGHFDANQATFNGVTWLDEVTFGQMARFGKATFDSVARFSKTVFVGGARFEGVTFNGLAWFSGAKFATWARLDEVTFNGNADFDETVFDGDVLFGDSLFGKAVTFSQAVFAGDASTFGAAAYFNKATFDGDVSFDQATFGGNVRFDGATFHRDHAPIWPEGFAEPAGLVWAPVAQPAPASLRAAGKSPKTAP
ncbi:pentapeptide repeat-containing protein [Catenulispora rubra]|uniref:pentapeptide repeat-containing protein n=1 Tax=Catenulispora rubra TaxID=280293 RepID=UPI0018926111|nr:pentapeptide repeat-containing protein [Catenulispora rubra]